MPLACLSVCRLHRIIDYQVKTHHKHKSTFWSVCQMVIFPFERAEVGQGQFSGKMVYPHPTMTTDGLHSITFNTHHCISHLVIWPLDHSDIAKATYYTVPVPNGTLILAVFPWPLHAHVYEITKTFRISTLLSNPCWGSTSDYSVCVITSPKCGLQGLQAVSGTVPWIQLVGRQHKTPRILFTPRYAMQWNHLARRPKWSDERGQGGIQWKYPQCPSPLDVMVTLYTAYGNLLYHTVAGSVCVCHSRLSAFRCLKCFLWPPRFISPFLALNSFLLLLSLLFQSSPTLSCSFSFVQILTHSLSTSLYCVPYHSPSSVNCLQWDLKGRAGLDSEFNIYPAKVDPTTKNTPKISFL